MRSGGKLACHAVISEVSWLLALDSSTVHVPFAKLPAAKFYREQLQHAVATN